jgi:hypothetical protein
MSLPFRRITLPASQVRLTASAITAVFFGFLLYLASTNLKWLTLAHGFLLLLGIVSGCLLGWYETRIVTRGLTENTKTIAWQILPVGIVLFGLPLLLGKLVLVDSEFLPFAGYLTLPAIPVFYAVSGWRFNQFEKKNKVQIFVLFIGYLYYKEPMIGDSNRLYHFIRRVASKDSSSLWQQTGYTKRLTAALEERQDIDSLTKKELLDILNAMNKYRRIGLAGLSLFLASAFSFIAIVLSDMTGLTRFLNADTLGILGPASGVIIFGFFLTVFLLLRAFQKKISSMLAQIDSSKLSCL